MQVNLTFRDGGNRLGTFGVTIDDALAVAPYTELLAFIQDVRDATECHLEKAVLLQEIPLGSLDNDPPSLAGDFSRVDDQAIMTFQSAGGKQTRITIPAPLVELFDDAGPYVEARVDELSPLASQIIATGATAGLLVAADGQVVTYRKGWRKGQKHP